VSPKKPYQRRLPTVLPPVQVPAPRSAPDEQADGPPAPAPQPMPEPEPVREPVREPGPTRGEDRRLRAVLIVLAWLAGGSVFALSVALGLLDGPSEPSGTGVARLAPRLGPDESYVDSRVLPTGEVTVRQWIRPGSAIRSVVLALPAVPGPVRLYADDVEVVAGGTSAEGPDRIAGGPATYTFDATTDVLVSYRLLGAVEVSDSSSGRALAVATSLETTYGTRAVRETRVVSATAVLSLACARTPERSPVPCGQADGADRWRVETTDARGTDRVLAQVDLG
jgi:hypothetical protein